MRAAPRILVDGVSKVFRLDRGHRSLRQAITCLLPSRRAIEESSQFHALTSLSFTVDRGEAVGIIGANGAGKSTVLKLLAGIMRPNVGRIAVRGRMAALIEVGAGFHGDLTGRENIFLNGTILGMRRRDIASKLDEIVNFAGLERFLDMPVKRYSSGMYARLGFSIAAHTEPEVLLVDEVLSVGDAVYRVRCLERMRRLIEQGATLVLVTHDLEQMQSICNRSIVLDSGRKIYDGPSHGAVKEYVAAMRKLMPVRPGDLEINGRSSRDIKVNSFSLRDEAGNETVSFRPCESVIIDAHIDMFEHKNALVVEFNLQAIGRGQIISLNSARDGVAISGTSGERVCLAIDSLPLCAGQYAWNMRVWSASDGALLLDTPYEYPMIISHDGNKAGAGLLALDRQWSVEHSQTDDLIGEVKRVISGGLSHAHLSAC